MSEETTTQPLAEGRRGRRPPPRISEGDFERAALRHLDRYSSSLAGLRAVLTRRAERSHAYHGGDREESRAIVDTTLLRMKDLGFLDDRRHAQALIRRLRRRGCSRRRIASRLRAKGIDDGLSEELLDDAGDRGAEFEAARIYARRRRLGVHRRDREEEASGQAAPGKDAGREADPLRRRRELGALARAGFDFDVASRALEAE
jgi:regulatory protein